MAEGLITIKSAHETEIVINKSRFIASIHPAETEEEAKAFIQKKKNIMMQHIIALAMLSVLQCLSKSK